MLRGRTRHRHAHRAAVAHQANDPIIVFGRYLKEQGLLDDEGAERIRTDLKAGVDADVDRAWNAADPDPSTVLSHLFADGASDER